MAIILLLIAFFALIFLVAETSNTRLSIVRGVIYFSLIVLFVTELLSVFQSLNYSSLVSVWSVFDVILIYFLIKKQGKAKLSFLFKKLKRTLKVLTFKERFLVGFSIVLLVAIFIQGLIYPPNNWDALAYHMPRIIHWIQNESLAHFRTPVYPQLNSPPFAEEFILNINLLLGNDYLSNAVQLFYFVGSGLIVSLIAKQLGLNRLGQILAAFIVFCLPESVLLASSTHTELVASFFMLCSIYYLIETIKNKSTIAFVILACSLGLAVSTKSTTYIYLAPFVMVWICFQLYQIIMKKEKIKWLQFSLLGLLFLVINLGHYSRNYKLSGSVFATNEAIQNYYVNEEHSAKFLMSTISRNISIQFGVPKVAPVAQELTEKFHNLIEVDVNTPTITSHIYGVDPLATHENNGANFYHTLLILLSCLLMLILHKKINKRILLYSVSILFSFLLFCFYLKWQPWAKLHTPFFIFYSIVLSYLLVKYVKSKAIFYVLITGFVLNAMLVFIFNYSRPIITLPPYTSTIKMNDDRAKKYFSRFLYYYDDYAAVSEKIKTKKLKNIGLLFGDYELEYPLFISSYQSDVQPIHLNAHDICKDISVTEVLDAVLATHNKNEIIVNGEVYYNVTKDNKGYLSLFLK